MARVSTSVALEKIGKGFGVASSAIGIIDGFRTLSEAGVMARRGELSSRVKTKTFLGSISIAGGVLAIACGSLVLIPAVSGLMTLVGAYMLVQLVPLNIRTWLRRSLYGIEQESVIGEPFKSSEEEMSSLQMVMQGIAVEIDVLEHRDTWQGMLEEAAEVNAGAYNVSEKLFKKEKIDVGLKFPASIKGQLNSILSIKYARTIVTVSDVTYGKDGIVDNWNASQNHSDSDLFRENEIESSAHFNVEVSEKDNVELSIEYYYQEGMRGFYYEVSCEYNGAKYREVYNVDF